MTPGTSGTNITPGTNGTNITPPVSKLTAFVRQNSQSSLTGSTGGSGKSAKQPTLIIQGVENIIGR